MKAYFSKNIVAVVTLLATALMSSIAQSAPQQEGAFKYVQRFNQSGQITGSISPDPDGTGPLKYLATRYVYDSYGRLQKIQTGRLTTWASDTVAPQSWEGYGFKVYSTTQYYYDSYGRKTKEAVFGETNAIEALKEYTYNNRNKVECEITRMNPGNFAARLTQASSCVRYTEGEFGPDRIIKYAYNSLDMVTEERRAWGGDKAYVIHRKNTYISETLSVSQANSISTYTYLGSKLDTQTDANRNLTQFSYDDFKRLKRVIYPSKTKGAETPNTTPTAATGDFTEFTYDLNGNLKTERKRNGSAFTYNYDKNNRVTSKDGPGTALDTVYDYDLRGLTKYARFGSATGDGVVNNYDGFGNITSTTSIIGGYSRTITYQYDINNNRIRITHPDAKYFGYTYDNLDRVSSVNEQGSTLTWMNYDEAGRKSGIDRNASRNGAATVFGYDSASRVSSLKQDLAGTANDLLNIFAYNPASQVTNLHITNNKYYYQGNENLVGTYKVNGLNQYTEVNGTSITYDTKGNLQSDGLYSYTYDDENHLTSVSGPKSATLKYDPLGRLVQLTVGGTTRYFLYDKDALISEYAGNSLSPIFRYVHGGDVDQPLVQYNGSSIGSTYRRYIHADQIGSVVAQTDTSGNTLSTNLYDSYGIAAPTNYGRFGFTGQLWIPELGLNYYKARIYHSKLGRFLQTDPIGYKDGMDWYTYVGNDPVNATDPSGMAGCSDASQQGLDSVSCFESTNFDQAKSDNETVVSTPEMDAAAIENGESLLSENSERVGQIKDGTPASASEVVGQPVEKNGVITTTAKIPDSADAVIHSHAEKGGEIAPGPKDNSVVEGGRPNYIYHKGRLAVVEKSGGQYRLRIIQSYPTKREATRIETRLNKYQKN